MKVRSNFFNRLTLDSTYGLLNARSTLICWEFFHMLDWRGTGSLDDIQFGAYMTCITDLRSSQIEKVFDIFDLDRSGYVEFDEFYLLMCILTAVNGGQGKQFMYQHWRTCFELLDEDGSKEVSRTEFETLGFLFNFTAKAVGKIFNDFDVSGNAELDNNEFKLFVFAAMDLQSKIEAKERQRLRARRGYIRNLKKVLTCFGCFKQFFDDDIRSIASKPDTL